MRPSLSFAMSLLLAAGVHSNRALAQEDTGGEEPANAYKEAPPKEEAEAQSSTEEPKEAVKVEPAAPAATPTPAPAAPASEAPEATVKPKIGDISFNGYFRGGFGASNQKGRMVCFALSNPAGLVSKYRLGNECEVWGEAHFTGVVYAGDDGTVAHLHFMPTVYIPTTYLGYSPTGTVNAPSQDTLSTGATVSFPNLYVDLQTGSWLGKATAWVGTRYYKRESVYISDFFYWNPSGVGGGVEDIHIGPDLRVSYAAFAVDGEPVTGGANTASLPDRKDFGLRHDLQVRGIKFYPSGEFQVGFQYIMNYSDNPSTYGGWGVTLQHVQQVLGGENKLALQYGRGGGTGFGTLARYYYPDFSLKHALAEMRARVVDVLTIQPTEWLGAQANFVFQHDDLGSDGTQTDWISAGSRVSVAVAKHVKVLGEVGYDHVKKTNGSDPQMLTKFTIAPALSGGKKFMDRPELRLFYTYAFWNEAARTATIDSGRLFTYTDYLSGWNVGLQGETWW